MWKLSSEELEGALAHLDLPQMAKLYKELAAVEHRAQNLLDAIQMPEAVVELGTDEAYTHAIEPLHLAFEQMKTDCDEMRKNILQAADALAGGDAFWEELERA